MLLTTSIIQAQVPVTNNLVLWLRADSLSLTNGEPVTTWTDSSVAANDYTQTASLRPTFVANGINGLPAVHFDGAQEFMAATTTTLMPTGLTYFVVLTTTSTKSNVANAGNSPMTLLSDSSGNGFSTFGISNGLSQYNEFQAGAYAQLNGTSPVNNGTAHLLTLTHNKDGAALSGEVTGTAELYVDGQLQTSNSLSYWPQFETVNRLGDGYSVGDYFGGNLAEVLLYSGALSDANRALIDNYLLSKYSIAVPEVSTVTLLAIASVALLRRRPNRA